MTEEFSGGAYFPNTITMNGITYIKEEELVNSETAADAYIGKLIEERNYWEGKYRELDKLVIQKFGKKLD